MKAKGGKMPPANPGTWKQIHPGGYYDNEGNFHTWGQPHDEIHAAIARAAESRAFPRRSWFARAWGTVRYACTGGRRG